MIQPEERRECEVLQVTRMAYDEKKTKKKQTNKLRANRDSDRILSIRRCSSVRKLVSEDLRVAFLSTRV